MRAVLVLVALAACGDNVRTGITITPADEFRPALEEFAALTPYPVRVGAADDNGFQVRVFADPALPAQSYQLVAHDDHAIDVVAPDVLGAQYGTAAALEAMGFRFRHPADTFVPARPVLAATDDAVHRPHIRVRGLHLHSLHPAEGYFALWEPSARSTQDAHRIIDWVIKNRGNYLQWAALDDILDPVRYEPWHAFTAELIAYAHARGIRVGLNLQLFGASNLQLAFDLVDDTAAPVAPQVAERLPLLTDGLAFDVYQLSFGEFFDSDPQAFIDAVTEVRSQLRTLAPQAEMHALVHVGADQRVTYMGEDLIYYFLVKFADPSIIPDVHSVMFYDLFEPTGGAYHHTDFSEHRQFLLDRMCNGQPGSYHPETAYWIAFDDSMPQFMPLYVHNRWLDLQMLAAQPGCNPLDEHLIFSTGWEWGYWLHDVTALRTSYEPAASPADLIAAEFAPELAAGTAPVTQLIDIQREHLMLGNLVPYIAGREASIDLGRQLGIVSQPDRVTFDDLVAGADAGAFETTVMQPLATYADKLDALELGAIADDRWGAELRDGLAIDRLRARFVLATYGATLAHLRGDDDEAHRQLDRATQLAADASVVVARRHRDLHDDHERQLVDATSNQTFYQYGYLFMADTLCFWNRELVQVGGILGSTSEPTPSCLF